MKTEIEKVKRVVEVEEDVVVIRCSPKERAAITRALDRAISYAHAQKFTLDAERFEAMRRAIVYLDVQVEVPE